MMGSAARFAAFAIAGLAMVDPSVTMERRKPLAVEFMTSGSDDALRVRDDLLRMLGSAISNALPGHGDALVVIDQDAEIDSIREGVSVSFVTLGDGPNVRLVRATTGGPLFPGQRGAITIDAEAQRVTGQRSKVSALQNGVEIGSTEHVWTDDGDQQVTVPFVALTSGSQLVRVVAEPLAEERRRDDNALDANVTTTERRFRVALIERRPSWAGRFVRQAIEDDPRLEVSSLTRASRGVDVRAGSPPSLAARAVDRVDLLAIGAPEELTSAEVQQLRAFMTERGGTVLLLPDRRPSGPITALIPSPGFDEVLHAAPVAIEVPGRSDRLRASEFAIPRTPIPSMQALATLPDGKAVISAWPIGAGTLIVSGALDAWRFRGSAGNEFASFWRAVIAGAAGHVPAAVSVTLDPDVASPGTPVQITARVRRTEFERAPDTIRLPSVRAVAVSQADGTTTSDFIRLWPASEPGVFRGRFVPSERRRYSVLVHAGDAEAAAVLLPGEATSSGADAREAEVVSAATGGVATTADRLVPLAEHLRSRPRGNMRATVYPMRHAWWILPFTIGLCIEWTLRRRRSQS